MTILQGEGSRMAKEKAELLDWMSRVTPKPKVDMMDTTEQEDWSMEVDVPEIELDRAILKREWLEKDRRMSIEKRARKKKIFSKEKEWAQARAPC